MRFVHFNDDTTVFAYGSDIKSVHATVNRELVGVASGSDIKSVHATVNRELV